MSSAQTQATSFISSGQADAERKLAELNAEVDRLTKRRDSIVAQLGALRDVVSTFAEAPAAEVVEAATEDAADEASDEAADAAGEKRKK